MADQGHLVVIPKDVFQGTMAAVAEYLRGELEYLAGGKLGTYLPPPEPNDDLAGLYHLAAGMSGAPNFAS